ncbi:AraC family transcriptional regulator [Spongiimicrobium salis]|uniref:AraC family transcriptional regulator n=1 Tax=Spongiimicrobium salis TaxID=1667022 RepID=UPI00374D9683
MNFSETLILFFSFQAALLALLFSLKKERKTANRLFAIFLLVFSYNLFYNVLYWSQFDEFLLVVLSRTYYIPLSLYGALFFLYIRTIASSKKMSWKDSLHGIPFLLALAQFSPYFFLSFDTKMTLLQSPEQYQATTLGIPFFYPLLILTMAGYGIYTYIRFVRDYKNDPELSIWLRTISFSFILFTLSHIVYCSMVLLSLVALSFDYFITFFMILFIGLVCYFAFMHASIFNGNKAIENVIPFVKYKRTGLSKAFSLELKQKLLEIMENEKPYRNPEIRLDTLAEMLDISRHHTSQIINEHFSVNFFDFINTYRIREAERLLLSKKSSLSITDIAYKSGFNNRVSFYKAFRKIEGTTPSKYREHNTAS